MGFDLNGRHGHYFGNQVYWWHPLWYYVWKYCNDILTSEDIEKGKYNDGHFISDSKAKRIAQRLRELRDLGQTANYETEYYKFSVPVSRSHGTVYDERQKPLSDKCPETPLEALILEVGPILIEYLKSSHTAEVGGRFAMDNVSSFAEFCEKSCGFSIW